jgi:hypothetical protein
LNTSENNMVLEVVRNGDKYSIYKPEDGSAGALAGDFTVFPAPDDLSKPVVYVRWHRKLPCPVVFELRSTEPITGVGFAGCYCTDKDGKSKIELYKRKGPCGGNFFLLTDLTEGGATTVEVENWGHNRDDGYVLNLGFGKDGKDIFDPQIYNEGELPPPHHRKPHHHQ